MIATVESNSYDCNSDSNSVITTAMITTTKDYNRELQQYGITTANLNKVIRTAERTADCNSESNKGITTANYNSRTNKASNAEDAQY